MKGINIIFSISTRKNSEVNIISDGFKAEYSKYTITITNAIKHKVAENKKGVA